MTKIAAPFAQLFAPSTLDEFRYVAMTSVCTSVFADNTIDAEEQDSIAVARALLPRERAVSLEGAFGSVKMADAARALTAVRALIAEDPRRLLVLAPKYRNDPELIRFAVGRGLDLGRLDATQIQRVPELLVPWLHMYPDRFSALNVELQYSRELATHLLNSDPGFWRLLPASLTQDPAYCAQALELTRGQVFPLFAPHLRADTALVRTAYHLHPNNIIHVTRFDAGVRSACLQALERRPDLFMGMSDAMRSDPAIGAAAVYLSPDNALHLAGPNKKNVALYNAALAAKPALLRQLPASVLELPGLVAFGVMAIPKQEARREMVEALVKHSFYDLDVLEAGLGDFHGFRSGLLSELRELQRDHPAAFDLVMNLCKRHRIYRLERFDSLAQLRRTLDDREPKANDTRPAVLLIANRADWNGGFIPLSNELSQLQEHYRVVYVESGTDLEGTEDLRTLEPRTRFAQAYLAGHGSNSGIMLGPTSEGIDVIAANDSMFFAALAKRLEPRAAIGLISCSTGKTDRTSVAQAIATKTGHKTFAARADNVATVLKFSGRDLVGVDYEAAAGEPDVQTFIALP